MKYKTVHNTEYSIWYITTSGKEETTCNTYKSMKTAQNWIDRQNKPSYIQKYFIKPIQVTHQKLVA